MNLDALNWLVKSIISNFKCWNCKSWAWSKNINIKNIDWKSVLLDIICPSCWKSSLVKSEVVSLDVNKLNLSQEQLDAIKKKIDLNNNKKINSNNKNKMTISDNLIVELNNDLKKEKLSVSDLFSNEEK